MQTKLPFVPDVSHYKEIFDFNLISPRPFLFLTKASEAYPGTGFNHTDEKFVRFFEGAMGLGIPRGAYHFHRKAVDSVKQAEHFISVIRQVDILPSDLLILDVEEGGEKASQLWAWLERVKRDFPNNIRMIYSRKNILDPIVLTRAEKEYFRQIPIWTAGYPLLPDLYSTIPASYIPDQSKWGIPGLWQYSSSGRVTGITNELSLPTNVDMNLITPLFQAQLHPLTLGEMTMASTTGTCINADNKVWKDVGLGVIGSVPNGTRITSDGEKSVSGTVYIHITSPLVSGQMGWSKKQWFRMDAVTPPPPPPPAEKKIVSSRITFDDGSTEDLVPV